MACDGQNHRSMRYRRQEKCLLFAKVVIVLVAYPDMPPSPWKARGCIELVNSGAVHQQVVGNTMKQAE
jgi:hypothetical protein